MEPVRILHVLASLNRGGAESMIMTLYRHIDRQKVQFDFVVNEYHGDYEFEPEINLLGGRVFRIPRYNIVNHFSYVNSWKSLLKEHPEWNLIHGHHTSTAAIYMSIAKSVNLISIAHSHTSGGDKTLKSQQKKVSRFPLRYIADHLFACSLTAACWMFGSKHKEAIILNNAIDAKKFRVVPDATSVIRKELRLEDKLVLGHIGNFSKAKNYPFLIEIFSAIHKRIDNASLLLIGNSKNNLEVEKRIIELGLNESVVLTGVRSDIPDLLQAMDVFLFPSLYEGLPVTVIEAQASGLKCILSDTITPEVKITDLVEFISLKKPAEYWADRILEAANGYERKDMSRQIMEAGYDVVANAQWIERFYLSKVNNDCKPA